MKRIRILVCLFSFAFFLFSLWATTSAPVINTNPCDDALPTISFNDIADNTTLIGNEYSTLGVVFSGHRSSDGAAYPMIVGYYSPSGTVTLDSYCNYEGYIQANFNVPVNYVSVDITPFEDFDPNTPGPFYTIGLELYDALDNLIAVNITTGEVGMTYHLVTQGSQNAAYARFYGYYPGGINAVYFDNFTFGVCPIVVDVDIKPGSCPNPLNIKSKGVLAIAILGTEDFDVTKIDPASIKLGLLGDEVVSPLRWALDDVATPFEGNLCDCHEVGSDGYLDLTFKFDKEEVVNALGFVNDEDVLTLSIVGVLEEEFGGTLLSGQDCVRIKE